MGEAVGVIGLGVMGAPMARNLLESGHEVTVHNRSQGAVRELAGAGARAAVSARELAEASDVVITMLPGSPETVEIVTGPNGVLEGAREHALLIDMCTSSPMAARELAQAAGERGVGVLDAPVSGGDVGARQGTLSIMVGGNRADFDRARPLLEAMGTPTHVGAHGAGQTVKACNQIVVALVIEAVSEALVLGSKAGVDPGVVLEVLSGGLAANRIMEVRGRNFLEHDFEPGGKAAFHHRDLGLALAAAREHGVSLPVTALVEQMFAALVAKGRGDRDHSALLTLVEEAASHQIGSAPPAP